MNHISNYTNKTTVKTISKLIFSFVCFASLSAKAADNGSNNNNNNNGYKSDTQLCIESCEANKLDNNCYSYCKKTASDNVSCNDIRKQRDDAKKEIGKLCSDAGIGADCVESVQSCGQAMGSGNILTGTAAQYLQTTGSQYASLANALNTSSGGSCPQLSGKTYFSRKESINKELDSTQKELADLNDDKAKVQDDFNKQIQDMQDELNKAQEELDKQKLEMKDKKRKQLAEFQDAQNRAKEDLRKKSTDLLSMRGQLISSQQDQALQLIALSDAQGKRACNKAVADAKKAYDAIITSGSGSYIGKAKAKKQDLIATYNDCMDMFEQKRGALNKAKKQEQDQINKAISDTQQSADELTNSMNTASSQLAEMQQDAQTEEDAATQKVVKLMQTNQNKMLAAQQKMQSNLQTLEAKNQSLSQKLNRLNSELSALGPVPPEESTKAPKQIGTELGDYQDIVDDINTRYSDCFEGTGRSGTATKRKAVK